MNDRKKYLDNIRWITVVIVVIYHIIYLFNCSGVISNINIKGIPIMDSFLIFVYPWFMCLLFVVAGISSKYSLEKRTNKEFIKDRNTRILIPSVVGIFIYGWITGLITSKSTDMFAGNSDMIPGAIKYLIYCLTGFGPLWFCHVIYLASVLLVLIKKIDKKDRLVKIGKKINVLMLIPITILVWGSSHLFNMPVISVYRFGIYLFMFFLGYYVFSNEELLEKLEKYSIALITTTLIVGVIYTVTYYGRNYTEDNVLQGVFTNCYLWLAVISILCFGKKYLNFSNKFNKYMTNNNFNIYVLHYTVVLLLGYFVVTHLHLPFLLNYCLILIGTIIILPLLIEIVKRIPVINRLVLGIKKKTSLK